MPKIPAQSLASMRAELEALNADYERNKQRIAILQSRLTPKLSGLADLAGQHHPIPLIPGQYNVLGASGAITGLKFPSSAQHHRGIAKASVGRVHVNLRPKSKGGRRTKNQKARSHHHKRSRRH